MGGTAALTEVSQRINLSVIVYLKDVLLQSDKSPSHSFSLVFDINSGKV